MGAFMVFADRFELSSDRREYVGIDETEYPLSYGRLDSLKCYSETIGIPTEAWPDFVEVDGDPSRVSLADIDEKNSALKHAIMRVHDDYLSKNEELRLVVQELRRGRLLLITN